MWNQLLAEHQKCSLVNHILLCVGRSEGLGILVTRFPEVVGSEKCEMKCGDMKLFEGK